MQDELRKTKTLVQENTHLLKTVQFITLYNIVMEKNKASLQIDFLWKFRFSVFTNTVLYNDEQSHIKACKNFVAKLCEHKSAPQLYLPVM